MVAAEPRVNRKAWIVHCRSAWSRFSLPFQSFGFRIRSWFLNPSLGCVVLPSRKQLAIALFDSNLMNYHLLSVD